MKTLNTFKAPGISRWIEISKNRIIEAEKVVSDQEFACKVARETYKRDARGMYKKVQSDAKNLLENAKRHGLTAEKPYKLYDNALWTFFFSNDISPTHTFTS